MSETDKRQIVKIQAVMVVEYIFGGDVDENSKPVTGTVEDINPDTVIALSDSKENDCVMLAFANTCDSISKQIPGVKFYATPWNNVVALEEI